MLTGCLNEQQLAEYLNVTVKKLRKDRLKNTGIPYVKIGRCVRYKAADIETYIKSCEQLPEGYVARAGKASSEAISKPGADIKDLSDSIKPKGPEWKKQVVLILRENGIVSGTFSGKITLEIDRGVLRSVVKQEEF